MYCEYSVVLPEYCVVHFAPAHGHTSRMEVSETIQCPFCGQHFEVVIDTSIPEQRFTTDCEVCCRPIEIIAQSSPGEVLSLETQ